jgi:Low-density lipoprotein receptor repeat class B
VDPDGGRIYWTDTLNDNIMSARLDGSDPVQLVSGQAFPQSIALDLARRRMYWPNDSRIWSANLDGTDQRYFSVGLNPLGAAVDSRASKVYWTETVDHSVRRANLDGTDIETLVAANLDTPWGIAVDTPTESALASFLVYRAREWHPRQQDRPRRVVLKDRFGAGLTTIVKLQALGAPSGKTGSGALEIQTHLVGYHIQSAKGSSANTRGPGSVIVRNEFGRAQLDLGPADRLLVPSLKDLQRAVNENLLPEQFPIEHFKCYDVRGIGSQSERNPRRLFVSDQFATKHTLTLAEPVHMCAPANKNYEGIANRRDHLVCYRVARDIALDGGKKPPSVFIDNQFGSARIGLGLATEFCVVSGVRPVEGPRR